MTNSETTPNAMPSFDQFFEEYNEQEVNLEAYTVEEDKMQNPFNSSFPVNVFPETVRNILLHYVEYRKEIPDMLGSAILGAVSAAVGKTYKAKTDRSPVILALWQCLIDESGQGKSSAMNFAYKPIHKRNMRAYNEYLKEKEKLEEEQMKNKFDMLAASKTRDSNEMEQLKNENFELEKRLQKLKRRTYIIDDITFETLGKAMDSNERGICLFTDELVTWFAGFGSYNKNGGAKEEAAWLKIYDGAPVNIERQNKSYYNPTPFVPIKGAMVPNSLHELARGNRKNSGFIYRMLFCFPPGDRPFVPDREKEPLQREFVEAYENLIERLYALEFDKDEEENLESHVLAFDKRAMEIYYEWDDKKVDFINSLRDPQKSSFYKSVHSRMKMHYIRLAGVMECLRAACHESSLEYVTYPSSYAAAQLCEYYEEQILKVFNFINASPYKDQSGHFRVNWRKVFGGKNQLEAREIKQTLKREYKMSERSAANYLTNARKTGVLRYGGRIDRKSVYILNQ
ncbi:DUF3987 domain-containing protein [Rapidithrix thailandica]|uniref:DUF3987 domain-containing protein n=1 Tax=Rapidithrix thailandica TaxID=413964 RepID=A0AAW9RSU7_9BACT